jgi:hypothetical protein
MVKTTDKRRPKTAWVGAGALTRVKSIGGSGTLFPLINFLPVDRWLRPGFLRGNFLFFLAIAMSHPKSQK